MAESDSVSESIKISYLRFGERRHRLLWIGRVKEVTVLLRHRGRVR